MAGEFDYVTCTEYWDWGSPKTLGSVSCRTMLLDAEWEFQINGEFVGGIDIVLELIENDEFDEMMPKECKKLEPKAALAELVETNPVILFVNGAEKPEIVSLIGELNTVGL